MNWELPARARLDGDLRLIEADAPIEALQLAAGAALDGPLAPPQLASVARLARKTGEKISRLIRVATPNGDAELYVTLNPEDGHVLLAVEQWREKKANGPRLGGLVDPPAVAKPFDGLVLDAAMRIEAIEGIAEDVFPPAAVGTPLSRLVRYEEGEGGEFPLLEALGARSAFEGQQAIVRHGGARIFLSGEPMTQDDGGFAGYHVRIEREPEEEDADESNATAGPGGLDETLRSPLDRIIRAADQIVDRSDGPIRSDYADYAGDIATAGRHLLSVIRSMSEQVVSEREEIKLSVVAREAAGLVAAKADNKGIEIEIEDDISVVAVGERRAVLQVLVNILGNAIRHSPEGGTVAIVFDEHDGRATVTVADQGPGIARADQKKIFEKFERLEAEEGTGTGLGLAISRRLARSMDGEIELDSAAGEGARFTLSLPTKR